MKNIKSLVLVVANLFILLTTSAQINVSANVDHINPGGSDTLGNIHIDVFGGSAPYTYKWTPGNIESQDLNSKTKNNYSIEIKDANLNSVVYSYNLGFKALWSAYNGTKAQGDSLITSGPYSGQNPTALGKNILAAATSGWAELVLKTFSAPYLIGFTDAGTTECTGDHYDIDFGFHLTYGNILYAWSGGNFIYLGQANTGDVVRISRDATMFYLYLNSQLVLSRQILVDKAFKLKALLTGATLENFGCSFDTPLKLSYDKEHAGYDNLFDGSVIVRPQGGMEPYSVTWPDGMVSDSRTGLFPGSYRVTVQDCTKTDQAAQLIEIGVKPSWKITQNILYKSDSLNLKESGQFGALVSYNTSFNGEESWFELKTANITSDYCFGFIGNNRVNMDTTVVPPLFPDGQITERLNSIKSIYSNAIEGTLTYQNGILNLGSANQNLFFVRINNATITSLIHGATSTQYVFSAGDALKIGRRSDGTIYFKVNDVIIFTSSTNISNQFLLSSILLKSPTAPISKIGIYTNATEGSYAFRLKRSSTCSNDNCKNWVVSRTFDPLGNIASESRQYYDNFGRPTQTQEKLVSENNILAVEQLYDSYGRNTGRTLPAPLYSNAFCYASTFFSNSANQHYSVYDFDKPNSLNNASGEKYNPAGVGNSVQGTLGWYYSNNNTDNAYVPADAYPYSRLEYYNDPLGRVSKLSDVGRFNKLGAGRETQLFYMDGGRELTRVYSRIPNSSQVYTYELDDNFQASTNQISILNPCKTVVVNADGHSEISYKTSSGKLLATCTTGNDPNDCTPEPVANKLSTSKSILIHIPKENNNSLIITNTWGQSQNVNFCNPHLVLHSTKYILIQGVDYNYNNSTGAITFLGDYANNDLFLDISYYQLILQTSPNPNYPMEFMEQHNVGYTNWTVYYYDVKGRLKAYVSPNEFVCQPASKVVIKNNTNPLAFSCDNTAIVSSVSLSDVKQNSTDRLDAKIEFQPQFNLFNTLKTAYDSNDFKIQTNAALAPKDSLRMASSIASMVTDSLPVVVWDSLATAVYNDSIYTATKQTLLDSSFRLLDGRSVRYEGDYIIGKRSGSGALQFFTSRPVHFNYEFSFHDKRSDLINKLPGDKISFSLDSADLAEAVDIVVKCSNLKIQVTNFEDSPLSPFSPCDLGMYVSSLDAQVLSTINANINLNTAAHLIATPSPTPPPVSGLPFFSKKIYYNEYNHIIATETPDEGRKDYFYDLREDKLLFSQNDKQRANGGKFNYYKYDAFGRAIESGEFDPSINDPLAPNYQFQKYIDFKNNVPVTNGYTSVGQLATLAQNLPNTTRCTEATVVGYDAPISSPPSGFTQKYLNGRVSYIFNDAHTINYTYDEQGQIVKTYESFNIIPGGKTMEYNYDFFGNLSSTVYQKGASDEFTHIYSLDADQRLSGTSFSRPPNYPVQTLQPISQFQYYLHGPAKRTVLGDNLQGLDYVYTIRGALKSVNSPHNGTYTTGDPGSDGFSGNGVRFYDFFRYTLDYYPNDYERNGTTMAATYVNGSFSQVNVSYTGQIRAVRWNMDAQAPPPGFSVGPYMYEYNYDELYRLKEANYGVYNLSSGSINFNPSNAFSLKNITYDRNGNLQTLKRYANVAAGNTPVLMDDLSYNYHTTKRNRLLKVTDNITTSLGLNTEIDFPNQTNANNYSYDEIGQANGNISENQLYEYNSRGLVEKISTQQNGVIAEFGYNVNKLRQWKISYNNLGSPVSILFYVYDIFGKQVCTYEQTNFSSPGIVPTIKDFCLYGGGRLGVFDVTTNKPYYELTDHLGNVRVVFTDAPTVAQSLLQVSDYYPHGGPIPGSSFYSSINYRYGYQGQEKDPETKLTNFEIRQMDPRLGRWLNPDPYGQHHSPYNAMSNNPVNSTDANGGYDEWGPTWYQRQTDANNPDSKPTSNDYGPNLPLIGGSGGAHLADNNYYANDKLVRDAQVNNLKYKYGYVFNGNDLTSAYTSWFSHINGVSAEEMLELKKIGIEGGVNLYDKSDLEKLWGINFDDPDNRYPFLQNGSSTGAEEAKRFNQWKQNNQNFNDLADFSEKFVIGTGIGSGAIMGGFILAPYAIPAAEALGEGYAEAQLQTYFYANAAYNNIARATIQRVGTALIKYLPKSTLGTPAFQKLFEYLVKNENKTRDLLKDSGKVWKLYNNIKKTGQVGE